MTSNMKERYGLMAILVLMGAGWGATQPLSKIAVSDGYLPLGLVFWQLALGSVILGTFNVIRGKGLPLSPRHLRLYIILAVVGTVLPNATSFRAYMHLPSGVMSIIIAMVPMFAFPVALAFGNERFNWRALIGLSFGLAGVSLLVLPEASLPERAMIAFIPLALVAPLCYAFEGNIVAKWGTYGLDAVQVLLGASVVGTVISLPLAIGTGHWINPLPPYGAPDLALVAGSAIHAFVYTGYVWMVTRAGAIFAAQVSYLVTGFGVTWAMIFLGESYSQYIWAAMGLMFVGMFLVQPRLSTQETADLPPTAP